MDENLHEMEEMAKKENFPGERLDDAEAEKISGGDYEVLKRLDKFCPFCCRTHIVAYCGTYTYGNKTNIPLYYCYTAGKYFRVGKKHTYDIDWNVIA